MHSFRASPYTEHFPFLTSCNHPKTPFGEEAPIVQVSRLRLSMIQGLVRGQAISKCNCTPVCKIPQSLFSKPLSELSSQCHQDGTGGSM